ncbi:MAG: Fe-S cluster assembly scaffold protein NifU [Methanosarcinaceae archaeon]|nr:Fe-S cluster assembly scaffold protein NifU [Methanosarcinaceae archaeon]
MTEPFEYSEKVKDHFRNPRNVGTIKDADGVGRVGNPVCGDMMEIQLKVEDDIIKDIKFKTFGCASAIATSSMVTEMAKGKTLEEALEITRGNVADELEGLPPIKMHCSNLAADALHAAIKDYLDKKKTGEAKPSENEYEVAVIGSGAAGLSAATISSYLGLKTVIFEIGEWGGILNKFCSSRLIENYPGLTGKMSPEDLIRSMLEDAEEQQVERKEEMVNNIELRTDFKILTTDKGKYTAKAVIIATGSVPVKSGILGESKFATDDGGVYYLTADPSRFENKRVLVYGNGYNAVSAAECLEGIAQSATLVTLEDSFDVPERMMKRAKGIEMLKILTSTSLLEIQGAERVEKAVLHNTAEDEKLEMYVDAVVLAGELKPDLKVVDKLGIEIMESGFVRTDKKQRTNIDGIYAVGNVATEIDLLIVAMAQGAIAAHDIYDLRKESRR